MIAPKRILIFKTITVIFFSFVIIRLISKIAHLVAPSNSNAAYELNENINQRNYAYAKQNTFGFTDKERELKKPKGVYRIAVLGDSFIWGDGMPYEKVWSHKLERKLLSEYDSIEVISWGKCGWSTLDEFNFFKQHGKDFGIDLLIIGWVDNDPDIGKVKQINGSDAAVKFPLTYKLSPMLARYLRNSSDNNDYNDWIDKIYSPQNLKDYQLVLTQFRHYLTSAGVQSVIVMTPAEFREDTKQRFDTIQPILFEAGFQNLNLYTPLYKKLGKLPEDKLRANPANDHPGDLLTEEYANEVEYYLIQNNYLKKLKKRSL